MPSERKFLHDLASPLSTLSMLLDMAEEKLAGITEVKEASICLKRARRSVERMRLMMNSRRVTLKEGGDEIMAPLNKPLLLVVEDDDELRAAICLDLDRRGYEVLSAEGGREAFEKIKDRPVDLIITDVRMPDGDGVELLKRVKESNFETPVVIFITGFADLGLEDAYDLGADAVLSKPFERRAFFDAIEKALTPKENRWIGRPERLEADLNVELQFPGLDASLKGHLLNIGRGGIFVAFDGPLPLPGACMEFSIDFDQEESLVGQGIVRWTRACNGDGDKLRGLGLEFCALSAKSRQRVSELLAFLRTKAFIPAA